MRVSSKPPRRRCRCTPKLPLRELEMRAPLSLFFYLRTISLLLFFSSDAHCFCCCCQMRLFLHSFSFILFTSRRSHFSPLFLVFWCIIRKIWMTFSRISEPYHCRLLLLKNFIHFMWLDLYYLYLWIWILTLYSSINIWDIVLNI